MLSTIITGTNASGLLCPPDGLAIEIRGIQIDVPLNEVGSTDPSVTLSGRYTGAVKFHNDVTVTKQFGYNECVYITSELATAEYTAVIDYLLVGCMDCNTPVLSGYRTNWIPVPKRLQ